MIKMEKEEKTIKPEEIVEVDVAKEEIAFLGEVPKSEEEIKAPSEESFDKDSWKPKTALGRRVKSGEISSMNDIFDGGLNVKEVEIINVLMPNLENDLLLIGQSKGKFGGGKRRIFKQTQKKTKEGNKPNFATMAIVGNRDGFIGIGYGKSKETVPAREKALRNAKLNIMRIKRGCGSWQCSCKGHHSIPFTIEGKVGSVKIKLMPAPKGTGLRVEKECAKILKLVGITDVWSKTIGQTRTKLNHVLACFKALKKLSSTKTSADDDAKLGIVEGMSVK